MICKHRRAEIFIFKLLVGDLLRTERNPVNICVPISTTMIYIA